MVDLTLRGAKGEPLTSAELDANWTALKEAVEALQAATINVDGGAAATVFSPSNGAIDGGDANG